MSTDRLDFEDDTGRLASLASRHPVAKRRRAPFGA